MMSLTDEDLATLRSYKDHVAIVTIRKALEFQEKIYTNKMVSADSEKDMFVAKGQVQGVRAAINIISNLIEKPA